MKTAFSRFLLPLSLVIALSSCATTFPLQVIKPAEINMSGARRIAILDFDYPREKRVDDLFDLLYLGITGDAPETENAAEQSLARYATRQITETLTATGHFTVISSGEVINALGSGGAKPSAIEIGKRTNVQAIIVGEIVSAVRQNSPVVVQERQKNFLTGADIEIPVVYNDITDTFTMTYRVVSTVDGRILATRTLSNSVNQRTKVISSAGADIEEHGRMVIRDWMPVISRQLAPYTVTEYRSLQADKAKDPAMKETERFVKNGAYDEALARYIAIWGRSKNPAAGVNACILYEASGQLDRALALIDEVISATGDKGAVNERKHLRQVKEENENLSSQLE